MENHDKLIVLFAIVVLCVAIAAFLPGQIIGNFLTGLAVENNTCQTCIGTETPPDLMLLIIVLIVFFLMVLYFILRGPDRSIIPPNMMKELIDLNIHVKEDLVVEDIPKAKALYAEANEIYNRLNFRQQKKAFPLVHGMYEAIDKKIYEKNAREEISKAVTEEQKKNIKKAVKKKAKVKAKPKPKPKKKPVKKKKK